MNDCDHFICMSGNVLVVEIYAYFAFHLKTLSLWLYEFHVCML